jgi:hypothetical protein
MIDSGYGWKMQEPIVIFPVESSRGGPQSGIQQGRQSPGKIGEVLKLANRSFFLIVRTLFFSQALKI